MGSEDVTFPLIAGKMVGNEIIMFYQRIFADVRGGKSTLQPTSCRGVFCLRAGFEGTREGAPKGLSYPLSILSRLG